MMNYELINNEYLLAKEVWFLKKKITNTHFTIETRTIIENYSNEGKNIQNIKKYLDDKEIKEAHISLW